MAGVTVKSIELGGWGQRSGIQMGDVIESYDGVPIDTLNAFEMATERKPHGAVVIVNRGGEQKTLVTLREPLGFQVTEGEPYQSEFSSRNHAQREPLHNQIIVTTTPSVDGYRVEKVVDLITAECVFGMEFFQDLLTSLTDFFGGRSGTSQNVLRDARRTCINELKREAFELGANAVIGVSLAYSEFSGQGKSMLFLVASGTAVVLAKIEEPSVPQRAEP